MPLPAVFVQVATTWLEPAVLATRTAKVCEPSESPVSVSGEVQATAALPSREHVVVVAPEDVQAIVAEVPDVVAGGSAVSVTVGATVVSGAAEARPTTAPATMRAIAEEMRRRKDMRIVSKRCDGDVCVARPAAADRICPRRLAARSRDSVWVSPSSDRRPVVRGSVRRGGTVKARRQTPTPVRVRTGHRSEQPPLGLVD